VKENQDVSNGVAIQVTFKICNREREDEDGERNDEGMRRKVTMYDPEPRTQREYKRKTQ